MTTIGTMYIVRTLRGDGGEITYRTTDRAEARLIAERFGATVEID